MMIRQKKCLVRYANISDDRYWFGFRPDYLQSRMNLDSVVLLCGDNRLDNMFIIPFEPFREFVLKGEIIDENEYHATIFPKRNNVMKATGNSEGELGMSGFEVKNLKEFFH